MTRFVTRELDGSRPVESPDDGLGFTGRQTDIVGLVAHRHPGHVLHFLLVLALFRGVAAPAEVERPMIVRVGTIDFTAVHDCFVGAGASEREWGDYQ